MSFNINHLSPINIIKVGDSSRIEETKEQYFMKPSQIPLFQPLLQRENAIKNTTLTFSNEEITLLTSIINDPYTDTNFCLYETLFFEGYKRITELEKLHPKNDQVKLQTSLDLIKEKLLSTFIVSYIGFLANKHEKNNRKHP
jgi:hypothetical protein